MREEIYTQPYAGFHEQIKNVGNYTKVTLSLHENILMIGS